MKSLAAALLASVVCVCDLFAERWHFESVSGWNTSAGIAVGVFFMVLLLDRS